MSEYTFRLGKKKDKESIVDFMNKHWGEKHPIVNRPEFFQYYYETNDDGINFAIAEKMGKIAAICGFTPSNFKKGKESGWLSLLLADKAMAGAGLELLCEMKKISGYKTVACNNIRKKVLALYNFAGYHSGRINHYYRLARRDKYSIVQVEKPLINSVSDKKARLEEYGTWQLLTESAFLPPENAKPYKDLEYIRKRYYNYPGYKYNVYGVFSDDSTLTPCALLVCRFSKVENSGALRIVDYIGDFASFAYIGSSIDNIMNSFNAEYCDLYCVVENTKAIAEAGFREREEGGADIIPNYLHPPLIENTEYYYAASSMENFTMFKADGDQDRPNYSDLP